MKAATNHSLVQSPRKRPHPHLLFPNGLLNRAKSIEAFVKQSLCLSFRNHSKWSVRAAMANHAGDQRIPAARVECINVHNFAPKLKRQWFGDHFARSSSFKCLRPVYLPIARE